MKLNVALIFLSKMYLRIVGTDSICLFRCVLFVLYSKLFSTIIELKHISKAIITVAI